VFLTYGGYKMRDISKYTTDYKYSKPVLTGSGVEGTFDCQSVDIPFVFYHQGKYHMLYSGFDGEGYQSALATSDDLLNWTFKGMVLKRDEDRTWDKVGGSVTWMIKESDNLHDMPTLKKVDGKYWCVYHAYPNTGYEEGPAEIGMAWCEDENLLEWHRLEKPVYSWKEGDDWEKGGLYKACIIKEGDMWYLFYNAKDTKTPWVEQIGVAYSKDLINWERGKENPIMRVTKDNWDSRFVSDPYIVKDGDIWVNFYFGYGPGHAKEGIAFSKDLLHWEKHEEPLIDNGAEGSLDSRHAHKASVLYKDGILYHFYCAVRPYQEGDKTKIYDEFRTIALATSQPIE